MFEGLIKISSNFTLHLIKVGKLKLNSRKFKRLENHPYDRLSWLAVSWALRKAKHVNQSLKNSLKLTWSRKESVECQALFYLKLLKSTCFELFWLSSVKTTVMYKTLCDLWSVRNLFSWSQLLEPSLTRISRFNSNQVDFPWISFIQLL